MGESQSVSRPESFHFKVDPEKCVGCGRCVKQCSTAILSLDGNHIPKMKDGVDGIVGWDGCYRCQHCLAVCPQGAISILGRDPKDSLLPAEAATPRQLEALLRNRRSCRRYLDKEVPREEIDEILRLLENVPTGSNNQLLEFNVVYRKAEMDKFRKLVHDEAFRLAEEEGIYPGKFTKWDWENQRDLEPFRNPGDMFFVNAPHILVIHTQRRGQWKVDPSLAAAWFDLICASRGLGSILMSLPIAALSHMPELEKLLRVPEDHYYNLILGFGYPEIPYARGVQREGLATINELTF